MSRWYRSEYLIIAIVLESIAADFLIFQQFSETTRETVISQISGVFVTIEGVLIGLTPRLKRKWFRDLVGAGIGVPAISSSQSVPSRFQLINRYS